MEKKFSKMGGDSKKFTALLNDMENKKQDKIS